MCTGTKTNWTPAAEVVVPAGATCTLANANPTQAYRWNASDVQVGQGATLIVSDGLVDAINAQTLGSRVVIKSGAVVGDVRLGKRSTLEAYNSDLETVTSHDGHSLIRMNDVDLYALNARAGGTVTTTRARAEWRFDFDDMGGTTTLSRASAGYVEFTNARAGSRFEMRGSTTSYRSDSSVEVRGNAHVVLNGNVTEGGVQVISNRGNLFVSANSIAGTLDCYSNTNVPTYATKNYALIKTGQCRGI